MGTVLINTLLFRRSWGVLVLRKDGVLLNVDAHERKKTKRKKKEKKRGMGTSRDLLFMLRSIWYLLGVPTCLLPHTYFFSFGVGTYFSPLGL